MWERVAQTTAVVVGVLIVSTLRVAVGMITRGNTDGIPKMVRLVLLRRSTINNTDIEMLLFTAHITDTSFSAPSWMMLKKAMGLIVLAAVTGSDESTEANLSIH